MSSDSSSTIGIQEKIAARVLRTLMPLAIFGISIAIAAEFMIPEMRQAAISDLSILFSLLFVWLILHKGKIHLAAHMIIVMLCLVISLGMTMYGGLHAPIYILTLVAVPLIVLLYGPLYSFFFATAFALVGLFFLYLENTGMLHEDLIPPSWLLWLFISIDCYIIWLLTAIPDKMLHQALKESEERRLNIEAAYQRETKALQDLKEREEELRVALVKYKTLFESFPLGITILDTEGKILETNTVAKHIFEIPEEEYKGRSIASGEWNMIQEDRTPIPPEEYTVLKALKEKRIVKNVEVGVVKPDGTTTWINVAATPLPLDGYGIVIAFSDISDRKKSEEALRKSEERFRSVFDISPTGIAIVDLENMKYIQTNPSFQNIVGYSDEELISLSVPDITHPDDLIPEQEAINKQIAQQLSEWNFEKRYIRKDGKIRWVHLTGDFLESDSGRPVAIVNVVDITERKQTMEALRKSEERFRIAVECISDFIYERDLTTSEAEIFGDFETLLGFEPGEFPKDLNGWLELIHPDDLPKVLNTLKTASKKDGMYAHEYRLKRKDGTFVDFLDRGIIIKDSNGKMIKCIGSARDITARKQAEDALRKSEERYRDLVENSQDLICTHDLQGKVLSANETAARESGYPMKQILGMNLIDALVPDARQYFHEYLDTIQKEGKASGVMVIRTGSGEIRYWEYNNTLRTLGVDVPIVRGMAHDITERIQAEEERQKLEEQLRQAQKMEAVGNLAGGVAHEFNNLLQIILGLVEMVQLDLGTKTENGLLLEDVHNAGKRAADLTQQLLAFSRRQTLSPVNLDLNDLVQDELKILERLIEANIELNFSPGKPMGIVCADRRQIEVILMNLCVNARDAMPKGGSLTIDTRNVVLDENYCQKHEHGKPGHYVRLSVTDTGYGMNEEQLERIFEPFYTTKGVGKGTGLGLATVYGIVMQHHGIIDCYSEPGKGTAFNIYLPVAEGSVEKVKKREQIAGPGGMETILIADDEKMLLKLLDKMLTRAGYDVLKAQDGEEAVRIFSENADQIDLVLLDVVMPKLCGPEVMDRIKEIAPDMRFLFSSGYSENVIQTDFIIKKGLRLINKPYNNLDLLRIVRETLDT